MKTTPSGLKYQVLKQGTGTVSPKPTDTVNVHYHGTLLNGTVFDSSVERGQPISFPLNRVIPGWTEGLQLMKVGDKFKFEIPPNLAYGPNSPSPRFRRTARWFSKWNFSASSNQIFFDSSIAAFQNHPFRFPIELLPH